MSLSITGLFVSIEDRLAVGRGPAPVLFISGLLLRVFMMSRCRLPIPWQFVDKRFVGPHQGGAFTAPPQRYTPEVLETLVSSQAARLKPCPFASVPNRS
jgi:hypothetical protein